MNKKVLFLFLGFVPLLGVAQNRPFADKELQRQVDEVYNRMTVEERTAQLFGIRPSEVMENGKFSVEKCRKKYPHGFGHVCQFACGLDLDGNALRDFVKQVQFYLMNETSAAIPAIFHEEAISGFAAKGATVYPQQLGLSCTWNPELARRKTFETAKAMRAVGATFALSPMIDLIRTAHWSRIEESYGEDSYLTAAMGAAFVEGLQGCDWRTGVAACTKHFLGYGGGSRLPWKEIYEEVLFPHEVAFRHAGCKVTMTPYGRFRSEMAVCSDTLINKILRNGLKFDGLVVSDYGAVGYLSQNDTALLKKTAVEALNVGNDLEFPSNSNYRYLPELLEKGLVDREAFETSVKRALMLKAKLGLLDKDARLWNEGHIDLDPVEARKTAYELACQSVVMLKNDGILPLDIEGRKVALIGPNANAACCMVGDYTYQSMRFFWWGGKIDAHNPEIITLKEALGRRVGGALGYERGCEWSRPGEVKLGWGGDPRVRQLTLGLVETQDDTDWQRAIRLAEGSDVVIAALGENPALCGEARERNSIRLPGEQENLLRALIATGRPVILVMFGGRPQVIGNLADSCAAVLQAWYPGEEGGNAVADILLGNVCPSGRLSVSYPMNESRASYCYNNGEKSADVAYPFGYGLSYTDFECSDLYVPREVKTSDEKLHISCKVKNVGARVGAEVVQLYLSPRSGQPLKPIQLKGFARVELEPGESRRVEFVLSPEQLAYYTDKGFYMIEPGRYEFMVGASSEDIRQRGLLTLTGQAVKADLRTHYLTSWK